MKNNSYKTLFILTLLTVTTFVNAQYLKSRGLELKAHYSLQKDGVDSTGNNDTMVYGNHIFVDNSILSKGCRLNDTCLIETPQLSFLNDKAFAMQIDFKIAKFGGSIIQAGKGYRYLGLATSGTGQYGYKTASQIEEILPIQLEIDKWYTGTIIHNTEDSLTEVYLDGEKVSQKVQYLNHPSNDNIIANIDFSRGYAFNGYLKNLKVYSTNQLTSVKSDYSVSKAVRITPNPAKSHVSLDIPRSQNMSYTISDLSGRTLQSSGYTGDPIAVNKIQNGLYVLTIYKDGSMVSSGKFTKLD